MVIITPMAKHTGMMIFRVRDLVITTPTRSPSGVIAISVPSVKSAMPKISMIAPITKAIIAPTGSGAIVDVSRSTMPVMGSTEARDSFSLSRRMFFFFGTAVTCSFRVGGEKRKKLRHAGASRTVFYSLYTMKPPPVSRNLT